jgi:hypothetical protein
MCTNACSKKNGYRNTLNIYHSDIQVITGRFYQNVDDVCRFQKEFNLYRFSFLSLPFLYGIYIYIFIIIIIYIYILYTYIKL